MTPLQIEWAKKLGACVFGRGGTEKRFARTMENYAFNQPARILTEGQAAFLEFLVFRYRRQAGYMGTTSPNLGRERPAHVLIDLRNVGSP